MAPDNGTPIQIPYLHIKNNLSYLLPVHTFVQYAMVMFNTVCCRGGYQPKSLDKNPFFLATVGSCLILGRTTGDLGTAAAAAAAESDERLAPLRLGCMASESKRGESGAVVVPPVWGCDPIHNIKTSR